MGGDDEGGHSECRAPAGPRRRSLWDVADEAEDWDLGGEEEIVTGEDAMPDPASPQAASRSWWWALLILAGAVAGIAVWLKAGAG